MSDIVCAICGEPWDAYGVCHGDMSPDEAKLFLAGEGCPSCGFGTLCPWCNGTGVDRYQVAGGTEPCPECDGDGLSLVCLKCQLEYEDEQGVQVDAKGGSNSEGCPHCDDPDCHWLFHG